MSAERNSGKEQYGKLAVKSVAAGVASGLVGVAGITIRHHRELTHKSLEVAKPLQKLIDFEQRTLGVGEPTVWASVHQIHHQMTDVSLYPFYKIGHAMKAAEEKGISVPEQFPHLDPFVDSFSRDEVKKIAESADRQVRQRLGEEYKAPVIEDVAEIEELLNPEKPVYFYPEAKKHEGEWSQDEIARVFLTDPHSPALIDWKNGVQGIGVENITRYTYAADLFRDRPDLKPDFAQKEDGGNGKARKRDVIAGFVIPATVVFLARKEFNPKGVAVAAVAGGAIYGARAGTELGGGGVTNSFGHAGVLDTSRITQAGFKKNYEFKLNEDGSLATDTRKAGLLGKVLSIATLDEVGGQQIHHAYPEKIAYTLEEGKKAWGEAPWGKLLEKVADSKLPFIKRGKGFDLKPGERRPDVPHEAVDMIQAARVNQMRQAA